MFCIRMLHGVTITETSACGGRLFHKGSWTGLCNVISGLDRMDVLDAMLIRKALDTRIAHHIQEISVHQCLDSTSSWLLRQAETGAVSGSLCVAEQQTAGRGRQGRTWISPPGGNIYLSLLWRFPLPPRALSSLSLACGVAVARALEGFGILGLALKWPNDLLWNHRKLAGLLIEVRGEASGPSHLVVGLGLNVRMDPQDAASIRQPWVALEQIPGAASRPRNRLIGSLVTELIGALVDFGNEGLEPFLRDWRRYDPFTTGKRIRLLVGQRQIEGDYLGIAPDGSLRLALDGAVIHYHAGEISLYRPAS